MTEPLPVLLFGEILCYTEVNALISRAPKPHSGGKEKERDGANRIQTLKPQATHRGTQPFTAT